MGISLRRIFRRSQKNQRGQSIVEFILVLMLGLALTRFVYFNPEFGLSASLEKMMLRLGGHLEKNLKTGVGANVSTRVGEDSTHKFMGVSAWKN